MENKNILKLLGLKYSKFNYENKNNINAKIDLVIKYNVQCAISKENSNFAEIKFDTYINDKNETFSLYLQTIANFEIDSTGISDEEKNLILKRNTVAIIFPFVRSQISLLTTQPGITPIMLQPMDISSLKVIENQN